MKFDATSSYHDQYPAHALQQRSPMAPVTPKRDTGKFDGTSSYKVGYKVVYACQSLLLGVRLSVEHTPAVLPLSLGIYSLIQTNASPGLVQLWHSLCYSMQFATRPSTAGTAAHPDRTDQALPCMALAGPQFEPGWATGQAPG